MALGHRPIAAAPLAGRQTVAAAVAALFRRTLFALGTRAGVRQLLR